MNDPFFIIGMSRSGTSLLRHMINQHSELAVPNETHFFSRLWASTKNDSLFDNSDKALFFAKRFIRTFMLSKLDFTKDEAEELYKKYEAYCATKKLSYEMVLRIFGETFALKNNKSHWGEKTPAHLHYISTIKKYFPQAKFINVIRDPRDVSLSWAASTFNRGNEVYHAFRWRISIEWVDYYKKKHPDDVIYLKYEDLLIDPELQLKRVCNFLNVEYEKSMLQSYVKNSLYVKSIDHAKLSSPIDSSNTYKWKEKMSPNNVRLIDFFAGRCLSAYCYEKIYNKNIFFYFFWLPFKIVENFWLLLRFRRKYKESINKQAKVLND